MGVCRGGVLSCSGGCGVSGLGWVVCGEVGWVVQGVGSRCLVGVESWGWGPLDSAVGSECDGVSGVGDEVVVVGADECQVPHGSLV